MAAGKIIPLVAGNWKMNGLAASVGEFSKIIAGAKVLAGKADLVVCPPATLIPAFAAAARGSMVAVGGIGNVFGVIMGTALLTLMPEFFRFISDYKLLVYGALLFVVMRFAPEGLAGLGKLLFRRLAKPRGSS